MNKSRLFAILSFILLGVLSRFLPHPPNFTAINAIALFGSCSFGGVWLSLSTVYATMFLTDAILGFHCSMPYTYLSLGLIVVLGQWVNLKFSIYRVGGALMIASLIFFFVTNFGSWLTSPLYSKTFSGLISCYIAAIPFFANQVLGDVFYGTLLFGCFACLESSIPSIRLNCERKSI